MGEAVPTLAYQPAISVLMPVFDPEEEWVEALLEHAQRREVGG